MKDTPTQSPGDDRIAETIPRRANRDSAPLSYAQQRLYFLDKWEPGSSFYNVPIMLRLTGPLDLGALKQSLNEILQRHETLRTTFADDHGQSVQRIATGVSMELPVTDLTNLPESERRAEAHRRATEDALCPFDLARGPLFRASIYRSDGEEHVLVLVMHHIATDGWSLGIFFQELGLLYEAFTSGKPSPLPNLPIQYADFAVWQRQHLQGEVLAQELDYWKQQLQQLTVLDLPADRPRPPALTYRGASQSFVLPSPLVQGLKSLSRREKSTLFMTLLAAFETLLFRYCGQEDIAVGSPIANRNRAEIEGLIGFFVNTLILRTNLAGNPSFRELLARVRDVALEAYEHQDLPFEKLVEELKPQRDPSRSPLFQVMLVLQNAPETPPKLPGLAVELLPLETDTAKFDLTLELTENGGEIEAGFEYSTDLFDKSTIDRMIGHFRTLLESIVANPDQRLSELPLLTAAERHQLLVEWNRMETDYPKDACIHHLFEDQVELTPDAVAIVCEDREITYGELNARANQLGHYLKKQGVGPDVLVGVCVERSIEMVAGLLAILKAGGAYVPLDPAYPKERLAFMARDTGISLLLTHSRLAGTIPADIPGMLFLDTDGESFKAESTQNLPETAAAENLAYVMYTSGSTGTPKGIEIPHRGVVRLVMNTNYARLNKDEVFLHLAPLSFDASTFELWAPLLHGARCVLYPANSPSPDELGEAIRRHRVSTLWLTSSLFNAVIDEAPAALRGVSQLLIGGEQLSERHVRRAQNHLPGAQIINGYGPTESTTFACCYAIPPQTGIATILPIGRPIANTRIYILDPHRNPVPVGIRGEIYIGGDGLARGYLNRPELTAEKFVPDPFSAQPNARLYRTGDLGRYLPDGNIEFLGRIDHQVKIRGFRVEPGEIEAVLGRQADVREAAVITREDSPGDKRLVAYVVAKPAATAAELRSFLQTKLPDYMIPSSFVFLDAMPLAPGSKMDRRALPAPSQAWSEMEESYVAPRTPVEETLAEIWAEVLGVKRVGIRQSFFELGGHSILAMRLFSQVAQRTGHKLPLSTLFRSPTIEGMANALEQQAVQKVVSSVVEIQSTGSNLPLFVMHDLSGDVFFARQLAVYLGSNQPVYGIDAGMKGRAKRLEELATRYVEDLIAFQPNRPFCLAGYSFGGFLAYEIARQLSNRGLRVGHCAIIDTGPSLPGKASLGESLSRIFHFLQNIPRWVWDDLLQSSTIEMVHRIRRKVRQVGKRLKRALTLRAWSIQSAELEDIFELDALPKDYVEKMTYHLDLLREYQPHPSIAPVTIYRARTQPLFHLSDNDLGWGAIARGDITVVQIPGNHETIVKEPRVRLLAIALHSAIEKISH